MDQREEIKNKIDLVEFIGGYVPLKKAGTNFKALCPFHGEKTPSFMVSPERQIWKCFGCSEGGDVYTFLMKMEGISFGEALRELAKKTGVKLASYQPTQEEKDKDLLYEVNHLAAEYYHYLLLNHRVGKRALDYVLGRGITRDSLAKFMVGYSPNSWEGLQRFLVGKKHYRADALERAGLIVIRETQDVRRKTVPDGSYPVSRISYHPSYYDRFRGRLMFPLKDHRGNVCGFSGRVLDPAVKEAKYINTQETPIYHKSDLLFGLSETKEEIKKAGRVVLVEGELDMISSYQAGVREAVAIKGTALTLSQIKLLKRFTQTLVLALDADFAGDKAARRGIEMAEEEGLSVRVVELRGGKDPDEVAQKDSRVWQKLVDEAVGVYDFFIDSAFGRYGGETAEGKKKIGDEIVPILAGISNEVVKSYYVAELGRRLGVDQEAVWLEVGKTGVRPGPLDRSREKVVEKGRSRREIVEEYLLALALQSGNPVWLKRLGGLVKTGGLARIIAQLVSYLRESKKFSSKKFAAKLPAELGQIFDHLYLINLGNLVEDEDKIKGEFEKTKRELEQLDYHERLVDLKGRIGELEKEGAEGEGRGKKLEKALAEFAELSKKLGGAN